MADSGRGRATGRGRGGDGGGRGQFRGGGSSSGGGGRGDAGRGGGRGGPGRGRGGALSPPQVYRPRSGRVPAVDPELTRNEDAVVKSQAQLKGLDMSKLSLDEQIPYRPGYGESGQKILLWANYFEVNLSPKITLYRYKIDVSPLSDAKRPSVPKWRRLVEQLLTDGVLKPLRSSCCSDYRSTLVSCKKLPQDTLNSTISYKQLEDDQPRPDAHRYRVTLDFTGSFPFSTLIDYVTSTHISESLPEKAIFNTLLGIVINQQARAKNDIKTLSGTDGGRTRHYPLESPHADNESLEGALVAWRGFSTSVRNAYGRVLLNIQKKSLAMLPDIPLAEFMQSILGDPSMDRTRALLRIKALLKNVQVKVTHLGVRKNSKGVEIPKLKSVIGLAQESDGTREGRPSVTNKPKVLHPLGSGPCDVKFFLNSSGGQGSYITVADYFKQNYKINLNKDLPVINTGSTDNPTYLPAEVCVIVRGQPAKALLTPGQTQKMLGFAVKKPHENATAIELHGTRILGIGSGSENNATLGAFGLNISDEMITVPGRVLPIPNIVYGKTQPSVPRFGSWNMANGQHFVQNVKMPAGSWQVVIVNKGGKFFDNRKPQPYCDALVKALKDAGVEAGGSAVLQMSITEQTQDQQLNKIFDIAVSRKAKLLVFILSLPHGKPEIGLYNTIKRKGDIQYGVLTQCCIAEKMLDKKTTDQPSLQYLANIAMKINLKLGGITHTVKDRELGLIADGKTMLVGIDVTHPSPGSHISTPSVAGMVASINGKLGQFPACIRVQESRTEMVADLTDMLQSRLRLWKKHNTNQLPENIIVYRDGVGEGQYDLVLEKELPAIKQACQLESPASGSGKASTSSQTGKLPRISIVICGKRHNTRFYPTDTGNIDARSWNPPNGTVVDRCISEARLWDFFLQAHTALQGTARPAHYVVIHDEIFANQGSRGGNIPIISGIGPADGLQQLTHNLCYLYGHATKAVSLCTPAKYADILCERTRVYLAELFDPAGSSSGGSSSGLDAAAAVRVHPNIADKMFYI